ncbi:class I SAM-dependent methyltransferase [Thiomicrorhabdus chilensis]|uniref:class I SAM-dependent methyltransferase n=1 Tax=Thiomicrorhabdus chilensis TaxID=63656 RepID=UPI00040283A0|nr:class I SAM-dependent methyltransferase [Thiomicrorhabdus chilensis]
MPKTKGYEAHAQHYDAWFDKNPDIYQAEIAAIKQLLPSGKGIEIGAGSGRFTQPLEIDTGVEPAEKMREIAQQRGLNVMAGVAEALPVDNDSYDFAIFVTSTCFLDDPQLAYEEAFRVVKKQGAIVIAFLEKNSELGKVYEEHKHNDPLFCDATFYSYAEIESMLKKAGFDHFKSMQTILPESKDHKPTDILVGHDSGAFVVVRADKK